MSFSKHAVKKPKPLQHWLLRPTIFRPMMFLTAVWWKRRKAAISTKRFQRKSFGKAPGKMLGAFLLFALGALTKEQQGLGLSEIAV